MIWLIDYTHYEKQIDERLQRCKQDYFKLKSLRRFQVIGETAPVKSRVFATGLLRIATILSANGIAVRYLHYYMLEDLLNKREQLPETIAFSCVCPTVPLCAKLADTIKTLSPKTKVFIGGSHINVAAGETAKRFPIFDRLVAGYEKEAAEQIAERKLAIYPHKYVDYSLLPLPLSEYAINTFTSMGCPFHCDYCVDGRAPHFCASDNGQLDDMLSLLPPKNLVHFFDSVLGYSRERLRTICEQIKATKHNFLLSCDMRADLMDKESIKLLKDAGFVEIRLGMESTDSNLLQKNGRTLMYERFIDRLKLIRSESNLYITLYTITGLPGTNWNIQNNTLDECDRLFSDGLVDEIKNALYVPYPMSGVDYSTRGITILNNDWENYDRQSYPVYRTDEMASDDLWEMYIKTAERINAGWLKGMGFKSFDEVPELPNYYSEYVIANYLQE